MKADEIAAQRIAENAQKQTVQHTRQRYAAGVTDTYIGGTLEDLRNVEPLGNRAPELSQPAPKPAPQPTPKSTTKIPQGTTVTAASYSKRVHSKHNNRKYWLDNNNYSHCSS